MRLKDFRGLLKYLPASRMRVHTSSGAEYEISHPDYVSATEEALVLTVRKAESEEIEVYCSWLHVSHVEIISRSAKS